MFLESVLTASSMRGQAKSKPTQKTESTAMQIGIAKRPRNGGGVKICTKYNHGKEKHAPYTEMD